MSSYHIVLFLYRRGCFIILITVKEFLTDNCSDKINLNMNNGYLTTLYLFNIQTFSHSYGRHVWAIFLTNTFNSGNYLDDFTIWLFAVIKTFILRLRQKRTLANDPSSVLHLLNGHCTNMFSKCIHNALINNMFYTWSFIMLKCTWLCASIGSCCNQPSY